MNLISFYPGPSKVYSHVGQYVQEAVHSGLLAMNHRSEAFMSLYAETALLMKQKLNIPAGYGIYFVSSATECWEILTQSVTVKASQHFYNGAFGEKWAKTVQKLGTLTQENPFDPEQEIPVEKLSPTADLICVTQNETSNGTAIDNQTIGYLYDQLSPQQLLAIDATSSMGGVALDFEKGDIWFASVQKCFGLPAGMGVLILSEKAKEKARETNERNHYNSLLTIIENGETFQTHYTPNVLGINLLKRTLEVSSGIGSIYRQVKDRYMHWQKFFQELNAYTWLINNPDVRSETVLAICHDHPELIKEKASKAGLILGNGYGYWKNSTFRIANFPALETHEIMSLMDFLKKEQ